MVISLIAAVDRSGAIGRGGMMPWHISEDMKYFRRTTMGCTVVMGRRTWESLGCKALPGRRNVVVSHCLEAQKGMEVVRSVEDLLNLASQDEGETFIIGGGKLYGQMMPYADKLYITHVATTVDDADTFFPAITSNQWMLESISEPTIDQKSSLTVRFAVYVRAD